MRRLCSVLALLLLIAPAAHAARKDAMSAVLATAGPLLCDGTEHAFYWIAPQNVVITRVELFPLSDNAAPGEPFPAVDYHISVYSSRPAGRLLAVQALDHYAPFTGDASKATVFTAAEAPHLRKGDHVAAIHACQALAGMVSHSQAIILITYVPD